jgi:hypothetical protein
VFPETEVRGDDRFPAIAGKSIRTWREGWCRPAWTALDSGYHLYPAEGRVRLCGRDPGCLLAPGDRLGTGPDRGG